MNFYKVKNHFESMELSIELFTFTNKYVFQILTYYPKMKSLFLSQNFAFKTYLTISGSSRFTAISHYKTYPVWFQMFS